MDVGIFQEDHSDLAWMLRRISELVWENDPSDLDEAELEELIIEIREVVGSDEDGWQEDS